MSQPLRIADGTVVSIHFALTLDDGVEVDTSRDSEPLAYLHGHGNLVPGLEDKLAGAQVGAKLDVDVPPEEGYGVFRPDGLQQIPRSAFPPDFEVAEGMQLATEDESGKVVPFWIDQIGDDTVTINMNHPLAGQTLHFAVEVLAIRPATHEELEHGHPHGPGGHHHH
jgi:FKBP-type peptidyl-prolyl cis-trans isomerase SlyD